MCVTYDQWSNIADKQPEIGNLVEFRLGIGPLSGADAVPRGYDHKTNCVYETVIYDSGIPTCRHMASIHWRYLPARPQLEPPTVAGLE